MYVPRGTYVILRFHHSSSVIHNCHNKNHYTLQQYIYLRRSITIGVYGKGSSNWLWPTRYTYPLLNDPLPVSPDVLSLGQEDGVVVEVHWHIWSLVVLTIYEWTDSPILCKLCEWKNRDRNIDRL